MSPPVRRPPRLVPPIAPLLALVAAFVVAPVAAPGAARAAEIPSVAAARATAEPRRDASIGRVGLDAMATRYGTSHQRMSVFSFTPQVAVPLGRALTATLALPMSATDLDGGRCCRASLGNVTAGLSWTRPIGEGLQGELWSSLSLPSAGRVGEAGEAARFAATTELPRDAGLFMPGVTTLRLGGAVGRRLGRGGAVYGRAALAGWHADAEGEPEYQLTLPFELGAAHPLWGRLQAGLALTGVFHPTGRGERLVSALQGELAYVGDSFTVGARVYEPLDGSFRRLGMRGVGAHVSHSF